MPSARKSCNRLSQLPIAQSPASVGGRIPESKTFSALKRVARIDRDILEDRHQYHRQVALTLTSFVGL